MNQRLFEITLLLTEKGHATAGELARRFGVSTRTIYRDVDALSGAGIPVYTEKGKGGGIRLLPDYVLDKTLFTEEEKTQLVAHMGSLATLGAPGADALLDKMAALFGRKDSWLEVDFAPWGMGEENRALFRLLRDAILQRHVLRFGYAGVSGTDEAREVEPATVLFRGQGWYLRAFCRSRAAFRYFKLNRMRNVTATGETFEPKAPPPVEAPYTGTRQNATLRFAPEAAYRVLDEFPPEHISPQKDGGFIVESLFPGDGWWLVGYLLSFGPQMEVLGPPELRRQVGDALKVMVDQYKEPTKHD